MPRGATAAREKKWEEAAVGVGDVPFHPDTLWRNLRHAKGEKSVTKTQRLGLLSVNCISFDPSIGLLGGRIQ